MNKITVNIPIYQHHHNHLDGVASFGFRISLQGISLLPSRSDLACIKLPVLLSSPPVVVAWQQLALPTHSARCLYDKGVCKMIIVSRKNLLFCFVFDVCLVGFLLLLVFFITGQKKLLNCYVAGCQRLLETRNRSAVACFAETPKTKIAGQL